MRDGDNGVLSEMLQYAECVRLIRDYCLLFQGGVKVLITGPWQEASSDYSCLFDQITVPASLIQPGVLRCYCPGTHKHTDLPIIPHLITMSDLPTIEHFPPVFLLI